MGNYHPHGDKAIYDALARFAQDFSVRYPLIEGQGNFGNIDGDNPAAQRYTEARLSKYSIDLLEGLDEDSVDFKETYDSSSHANKSRGAILRSFWLFQMGLLFWRPVIMGRLLRWVPTIQGACYFGDQLF